MSEFGSSLITMMKPSEIVRSEYRFLHAAGRGSFPIAEITGCDGCAETNLLKLHYRHVKLGEFEQVIL